MLVSFVKTIRIICKWIGKITNNPHALNKTQDWSCHFTSPMYLPMVIQVDHLDNF